jgi:hypothetical protein
VAVDPRLIQRGSSVFIPAYCETPSEGWFTAADTGGAIIGRHIDVYRPPPATPDDGGQYLTSQRIYVVPPGKTIGRGGPSASSATPKLGAATPPQGAATTDPAGGAAAP